MLLYSSKKGLIMKVIKNKGAFVQYDDSTWGIDTRIKVNDEYRHFKKKGYPTLSAAKADFERAKAEFISSKSMNKYEVLIFDDLLVEYEKMRKVTCNPSTLGCDQSVFNVYILPYFSKKLLKDCFNTEAITEWYHNIVDDNHYTNNKKAKVITRMKDLLKFAYMHKYVIKFALAIYDFGYPIFALNHADIADLTAALAIKRSLIGYQLKLAF